MPQADDPLLPLAAQIVIAHVENNDVTNRALPELIRGVYQALASAGARADQAVVVRTGPHGPANAQTVFDDHLICLECGLHMKMLKRHFADRASLITNAVPVEVAVGGRLSNGRTPLRRIAFHPRERQRTGPAPHVARSRNLKRQSRRHRPPNAVPVAR